MEVLINRNLDYIERALNDSTYRVKMQTIYDGDGKPAGKVWEFFDFDSPEDKGMLFTSYEDALVFYDKHIRLDED